MGLDPDSLKERAVLNEDLCVLDHERFFIRGVVPLPLIGAHRSMGIGAWAEVLRTTFIWYVERYEADLRAERPSSGKLANTFHGTGYPDTLGLGISVVWGALGKRPTFTLEHADHPLYRDQQRGITLERAHVLLPLPS